MLRKRTRFRQGLGKNLVGGCFDLFDYFLRVDIPGRVTKTALGRNGHDAWIVALRFFANARVTGKQE